MALLTASLKFGLGLWAWAQARSTSRQVTSKCLKEKEAFCDIYYFALGNFSVKTFQSKQKTKISFQSENHEMCRKKLFCLLDNFSSYLVYEARCIFWTINFNLSSSFSLVSSKVVSQRVSKLPRKDIYGSFLKTLAALETYGYVSYEL